MLQPPAMAEISDEDVNRELAHLYEKRHDILRTGSADAWANHRERTDQLEAEYLRRFSRGVAEAEAKLAGYGG
ncbi:DUF6158 family protein [Blastococcus sp. URHD0036]|uniref:DUF6158 family protein n=1 Tax=Blastococcus sp. URHD0036 TaxID=1380356 RepID=UPI000553CAAC|nr:DUF6158 family protein [Blastococcus sp. URHD0036]